MPHHKKKILRIATVAMSLDLLLKGQLAYLDRFFEVRAVSGEDAHLRIVREREGVVTIDVAMSRSIHPLKDLKALIRLYRVFRKERPALIHSITPKAGLLSMVAGKLAGVPVRIHTFTGLIFPYKSGFLQRLLIVMDKILCRCATHIFPEGEGVRKDLQQYGITKKPLKIIANGNVNGIDLSYYDPALPTDSASELPDTSQHFVFTFVGRLVGDKGINELVSAFHLLNREYSNIRLVLVGPYEHELDPLQPDTLETIRNNPHIITPGFVRDIRPYLKRSHCFVFPSYREGFPNVVLQAGAMNLPCIVTDIPGSNEIITEGFNGLICPKKDTNALYEKMKVMLTDDSLRESLTLNARSHIQQLYRQEYVWECLKNEYESLLNNV